MLHWKSDKNLRKGRKKRVTTSGNWLEAPSCIWNYHQSYEKWRAGGGNGDFYYYLTLTIILCLVETVLKLNRITKRLKKQNVFSLPCLPNQVVQCQGGYKAWEEITSQMMVSRKDFAIPCACSPRKGERISRMRLVSVTYSYQE